MRTPSLTPAPALLTNPVPHPDNLSSLDALLKALSDLDDLCVTIDEAYQKSLQEGRFERWNEES